jgi:hypothetical protein
VILAALLLPLFVLASFDFGATWDEKARHRWRDHPGIFFAASGAVPPSSRMRRSVWRLFDTICAVVEQWTANRACCAIINAIFGWIGVVCCGRLAASVWPMVRNLAMILLASSPRASPIR